MAVQNGSISTNIENGNYFWVKWSQYGNQNISNNSTKIYWEVGCDLSHNYYSNAITMSAVTINGSQVYAGGTYSNFYSGSHTISSGYLDITHNTNGTKTFTISSFTGWLYPNHNYSASATNFELPTIPRASSITATNTDIESATSININRVSSNFTHTITYSFLGLTGTIATKTTDTSIGWIVPSSFYAKIPNAKTGTVTLTCTTYNDNTSLGSKTTTFTITANEDICKPTITATLIDSNATTVGFTGDNTKLIKYKSTAKITPSITTKNDATVSLITVNGMIVTGDYIEIQNVESETFNVAVVDSRGYTNFVELTPSIVQYIPLTVTAKFQRTTPTGTEIAVSYSGNGFSGYFNESQTLGNQIYLNIYLKVGTTWSKITISSIRIYPTDNIFSGQMVVPMSFDYRDSAELKLEISDMLSVVNYQEVVPKGLPYYDYGVDDNGNNYFNVNGYIYADKIHELTYRKSTLEESTTKSITASGWRNIVTNPLQVYCEKGLYAMLISISTSSSTNGIITLRPLIDNLEENTSIRSTIPLANGLMTSTQVLRIFEVSNDASVEFSGEVYANVNCNVERVTIKVFELAKFTILIKYVII